LGAAGYGPGAASIELAMPLQCPQLFEVDFSDGQIQEEAVDVARVPINA